MMNTDSRVQNAPTNAEEKPEETLARLRRAMKVLEDGIRMLEAENARLVEMLKQRGCEVQALSPTSVELPPPATEPLADDAEAWSVLDPHERALLDEMRQGQALFFMARSKTTVDVGHWFARGTLLVAATANELLLFAHGKKPYVEKIPFRFLGQSLYNHVTGEAVFSPALEARTQSLRIPPLEGYKLLAQVYGGQDHA